MDWTAHKFGTGTLYNKLYRNQNITSFYITFFYFVKQQCSALEAEMEMRRERIESKQQQLRELILQQVSFKSLVTRNKESEERGLVPSQNSAIQLPFITVNTHKKTQINCSISDDKYVIRFTLTFLHFSPFFY